MQEIKIQLRSVQDVQEFVAIATEQPFAVLVGNDESHKVSGGSFMEMFCLDFTRPMFAFTDCQEPEFDSFRASVAKFAV